MNNNSKNPKKQSRVGGLLKSLNFRNIISQLDTPIDQEEEDQNKQLLVSTAIKPVSLGGPKFSRLTRITEFLRRFSIFAFLIDLFLYAALRVRVVLIFLIVGVELLIGSAEGYKRGVVRNLFWGRSSFAKFSMQLGVVIMFFVLLAAYGYQTEALQQTINLALINAANAPSEDDLLVQNSSTKTLINTEYQSFQSTSYTVKGGDTLGTIAEQFGLSTQTILWANELSDGSLIKPGTDLVIPPGDGVLIVVEDGDTIESLAEEYESSDQLIIEVNELRAPYALAVDDELFLPDGKLPAPPPKPAPVQQAPVYSGVITPKPPSSTVDPAPSTSTSRWIRWPIANGGNLTQCASGWHNGIDIASRAAPNIVAGAPGVVTLAGCQSGSCPPQGLLRRGGLGLAWTVKIDHGNGYETIYGHLDTVNVRVGQSVSAGQVIGRMGQSGLATGIHLHFMVVRAGTWSWVNPAQFMSTNVCGY